MKPAIIPPAQTGFALVITLALLGLLVLAVFALSALTRVNARVAIVSVEQMQAKQNALLALNFALGELQARAGGDDRITAMAGVTGVAAQAGNSTRHWCGVWSDGGIFLAWLASGAAVSADATIQSGLDRVELVASGTVGAAAANSEHVEVGKLRINTFDRARNQMRAVGSYAYWVGDEGVKISAYAPPADLALAGVTPLLAANPATSASAKLRAAVATYAAKLARVISYEQLRLLPVPELPALSASVLQDNFHHATLTAYRVAPPASGKPGYSGMFNLNTNSAIAWRGLLETYNDRALGPPLSPAALSTSTTTSLPARLTDNLALAAGPGKNSGGPFLSVDAWAASTLLADALVASGSGVRPEELMAGIGPLLAVRSDTFRVRGYGDVLDPVDQATVRSTAYCEALVQRVAGAAPNGLGRRFVITYFRWLGPDDR